MLLRLLMASALVATATTVASPALADNHCQPNEVWDPVVLEYTIQLVCGPQPASGSGHSSSGGGGGGGGSNVTCVQVLVPRGIGGPDRGLLYWPKEDRGDDGVWGRTRWECSDGSQHHRWVCISGCPAGTPGATPDWSARLDGLLQEATAKVDPPLPGMRHSFDQPAAADGTVRAVVLAETWWWADGALDPISVYDHDGAVWARVTATPGRLTIDPGDGSGTFECDAPGLPYDRTRSYYDQVPGEPDGACVHIYEDIFDAVTARMSVTWSLDYEGFAPLLGEVSGSLGPQLREQTVTFPVREIQSVIVR